MHTSTDNTAAGLILSLMAALPDPDNPLGRRARRLADRLARQDGTAAAEAADITAALLDATDPLQAPEEGLLDPEFDE